LNNKNWEVGAANTGGYISATITKLTCTLAISTYTSATASSVNWYTKAAVLEVDGGKNSKWVKFETFVKMIGASTDMGNTPPTAPGSNAWVEDQGVTELSVLHSPVVNLIFGGADYYTGGTAIATAFIPSVAGYTTGLRRLPMNNIAA